MLSTMQLKSVDAKTDVPGGVTAGVAPTVGTSEPVRVRNDWGIEEVREIHDMPLLDLVHRAAQVHRQFQEALEVQVCKLVSVKTGGCPEDCCYCAQSSRYDTGVESESMLSKETVLSIAKAAKENGISRVCMGAAWREVREGEGFERVLDMIRAVTEMGVEVCCTLGMLNEVQARRLEEAGLYAYNHNLDTSENYYKAIITTREYADRLKTLQNVRKTKITVCCGGIIGLGESLDDRLALLQTLASLDPHPESVPINLLAKVPGTPLEQQPDIPFFDVLRVVATARILMPASVVRLSAGRSKLSATEQAFCFLAGANSIFSSETGTMLTSAVASPDYDADRALLEMLGLRPRKPFAEAQGVNSSQPAQV